MWVFVSPSTGRVRKLEPNSSLSQPPHPTPPPKSGVPVQLEALFLGNKVPEIQRRTRERRRRSGGTGEEQRSGNTVSSPLSAAP